MARLRYLIAGLITCFLHGVALSFTPQKNTINVSTEDGAQSLQIQLMTMAAAKPVAEPTIDKKVVKEPTSVTPPQEQKLIAVEKPQPLDASPIRESESTLKKTTNLVEAKKPPPKPREKTQTAQKKTPHKPTLPKTNTAKPDADTPKAAPPKVKEVSSEQASLERPQATTPEKASTVEKNLCWLRSLNLVRDQHP
ncbi:hypothetical protein NI382_18285 [Vibrio parahaemolyticus]|nr:hypothetical protein NI382_18285 [Vibrio parahaemolyticus]